MSDQGIAGKPRKGVKDAGFVTFRLGKQWLGVPIIMIQEVFSGLDVTPVPLSPTEVQGFLNLRGQIVTAIDLRAVMGLPDREEDSSFMNVVVQREDELFSLIVDEVGDVVEVDESRVEPTPKTVDPVWQQHSRGVIRLDEGLLVVLEVESVLDLGEVPA